MSPDELLLIRPISYDPSSTNGNDQALLIIMPILYFSQHSRGTSDMENSPIMMAIAEKITKNDYILTFLLKYLTNDEKIQLDNIM